MKNNILLLTLLFCFNLCFSQTEKPIVDSSFLEINLDEIIISASKFPEKGKNIAQQYKVIDEKKIKLLDQQTSADLLSQGGNVYQRQNSGAQ